MGTVSAMVLLSLVVAQGGTVQLGIGETPFDPILPHGG
jgi:hypothetical protein